MCRANYLACPDARLRLDSLLNLRGIDQKTGKPHGVTHARLEHELLFAHAVAQVPGLEKTIFSKSGLGGLWVVQVGDHSAGTQDFDFTGLSMRKDAPGLRVAHANARIGMDQLSAGKKTHADIALVCVQWLGRNQCLQLAGPIQPCQFQMVFMCPFNQVVNRR